jgi:acyl-coenzyme A synthetase/AMP-(fatty) acid ligase
MPRRRGNPMADWSAALTHAPRAGESWPLVAHGAAGLDRVFARRGGEAVTVATFLADAAALAEQLPPTSHVLNACGDRYHFIAGLAACIQRGIVTLLPAARTPGVIAHLRQDAPDLVLLLDPDDAAEPTGGLPVHRVDIRPGVPQRAAAAPQLPGNQLVARMYSSGSTGEPQPHLKFWSSLVRAGASLVERVRGFAPNGIALLGTVPAQHSYGFEATVLVALAGGAATHAARPFFPADIAAALEALPRPRGLVTTPYHLRTILEAGLQLPPIDLMICATAPLTPALAQAAERAFGAPLMEIYGATECGQVASRRTAQGDRWQPFSGVRVTQQGDGAWAEGGHVLVRTPLADLIELDGDGGFTLIGRQADMVNIAGKRSSLAYLNQILLRVPGVVDGAFFLADESTGDGEAARLAAAVVAPGQPRSAVLSALREHIDPVFLPRPLIMVPALPRTDASKLPVAELRALLRSERPQA